MKTSLLLTLLFSILHLYLNSLANTVQATPVVDLELAMDGVPDFAIVRKWVEMLQKAGFKNVRVSIKRSTSQKLKRLAKGTVNCILSLGSLPARRCIFQMLPLNTVILMLLKAWITTA